MLDWIFEGIVNWVSSIVTKLMDAVSGLFLNALGTDMTAMEEYFPFVGKAFTVLQYLAWTILFLITVWQIFRAFGGPITEAENPLVLLARAGIFALLIGFAKPIFLFILNIARAPYTALMDLGISREDFTFAGIENVLRSGLTSIVSVASVVGLILIIVLMVTLGWNYFKLLLEVVERYVVVGVLCYTSPLAYSMGASKNTVPVFKSWCRMVGSQLLLLVMNVWFLRAFNSSVGHYISNGGALSNGQGSIFLWMFCAIAFLKIAQRFDSYLASIGLNVAQTGSGLGMELLVATRLIASAGHGLRSAGAAFGGGGPIGGPAGGFMAGFANRFKGNSYVRDAVVSGGTRMGAGGVVGVVGRAFGGVAARNGAALTGESISSVATRPPKTSGSIAGDIADRSLGNYMPHLKGQHLSGTQITGGRIDTKAIGADGKETDLHMFSADQYDRPDGPTSMVTASDGSQWYQTASGANATEFFPTPNFTGDPSEMPTIEAMFPGVHDTSLRAVGDGRLEAVSPMGNTLWYNSGHYEEPEGPHTVLRDSNGVDWYAMERSATMPVFESDPAAADYNIAQFNDFMPGYEQNVSSIDATQEMNGHFEVRHDDGSGTMFYDASQYSTPRGEYATYEDVNGSRWYAVHGEATVEHRPVYENGKPVFDGERIRTTTVDAVHYRGSPTRYAAPKSRNGNTSHRPPKKK